MKREIVGKGEERERLEWIWRRDLGSVRLHGESFAVQWVFWCHSLPLLVNCSGFLVGSFIGKHKTERRKKYKNLATLKPEVCIIWLVLKLFGFL